MKSQHRSHHPSRALFRGLLCAGLAFLGCSNSGAHPTQEAPDGPVIIEDTGGDLPGAEAGASEEGPPPIKADPPEPCLADEDCQVLQDCCVCSIQRVGAAPLPCPRTCPQPACTVMGLQQPIAYCLKGQCVVGEGAAPHCAEDRDCLRVEDCAFCAALPRSIAWTQGFVGCGHPLACSSLGTVRPTCLTGLCRFIPAL